MPEEGSYVHSRGVAKCIWYNDKKLWSGGYNISGSKLNLWIYSINRESRTGESQVYIGHAIAHRWRSFIAEGPPAHGK